MGEDLIESVSRFLFCVFRRSDTFFFSSEMTAFEACDWWDLHVAIIDQSNRTSTARVKELDFSNLMGVLDGEEEKELKYLARGACNLRADHATDNLSEHWEADGSSRPVSSFSTLSDVGASLHRFTAHRTQTFT